MSQPTAPSAEPAAFNPANTMGLDYRQLARELPYHGPIIDCHTHVAPSPLRSSSSKSLHFST
ncbi:MAG: hypothetical protein HC794_09595 [Nitrospiraceae bacterium]|nr:hypothetical protein [Nitrospiraceae bacterium]